MGNCSLLFPRPHRPWLTVEVADKIIHKDGVWVLIRIHNNRNHPVRVGEWAAHLHSPWEMAYFPGNPPGYRYPTTEQWSFIESLGLKKLILRAGAKTLEPGEMLEYEFETHDKTKNWTPIPIVATVQFSTIEWERSILVGPWVPTRYENHAVTRSVSSRLATSGLR